VYGSRHKPLTFPQKKLGTGQYDTWIKASLKKLAIPNILDMIQIDQKTGGFAMDLRKVTREQAYAIQELGFDAEGRLKIKLHDKAAVLRFLHDDMAPERPARVRLEGPSGGPVEVIEGLGARLNATVEMSMRPKSLCPGPDRLSFEAARILIHASDRLAVLTNGVVRLIFMPDSCALDY
jgi:hypothetical protein